LKVIWKNWYISKQTLKPEVTLPLNNIIIKETKPTENLNAEETLIWFFRYLNQKDFEKALELFEYKDWYWLAVFTEEEEKSVWHIVLKDYCEATGTCLNVKIIGIKEWTTSDKYIFKVQFINKDWSIFVQWPCCGATEEQMPSTDTFEFTVKKVNWKFKVITAPIYRP